MIAEAAGNDVHVIVIREVNSNSISKEIAVRDIRVIVFPLREQ
jgi:hypothetical protein